jgi:hypothetical protein
MVTKFNFKQSINFVSSINEIYASILVISRPKESYFSEKRRVISRMLPFYAKSINKDFYPLSLSLLDFNPDRVVGFIDTNNKLVGNYNKDAVVVIQASNILPEINIGVKLGFSNFFILKCPEFYFRKCLLLDNTNLVFIPNFKVSYTSINELFARFDSKYDISKKNSVSIDVSDSKYSNFYKFSIVRHPFERFLSFYNWTIKRNLYSDYIEPVETLTNKKYSEDALLDVISCIPDAYSNNHWLSQSYKFKINRPDEIFSINQLDFLENKLSTLLNLDVKIPHTNVSGGKSNNHDRLSSLMKESLLIRYSSDLFDF